MGKQTTKRCHWVSQAYLRSFAFDLDTRERIWRFSKNLGDPELKRIEKVAVKYHLYSPLAPDGRRDDHLEKKLASLETWFATPQWEAAGNDFPDLTWVPLRKMLALLAATTFLRNPKQFDQSKAIHRELTDLLSSANPMPEALEIGGVIRRLNLDGWDGFREANEEELKREWCEMIGSCGWLAQMFLEMRWAVIFSDEPVFITSDNPVMFINPADQFKGLRHQDTAVVFPLSPKRLLMMDNRHGEPDAQYYKLREDDPGTFNVVIWRNAIEHMFTSRHPDIVCSEILAAAEQTGQG